MLHVYSTYEAKSKFSEVMRRVRAGQRVIIAYRGKQIAEIAPIESKKPSLEGWLKRLEDEGVLSPYRPPTGPLRPLAKRPGALARFLGSRE